MDQRNLFRPKLILEDDLGIYLHHHAYYAKSHEDLLAVLPVGTDTVLADETKIKKESENNVEYTRGKKTLEYFYVSREPKSICLILPKMRNLRHWNLQKTGLFH